MSFLRQLADNYVLMAAILAWVAAQALKTIIDFTLNKQLNPERLVGAGGMPSSHSALVCAFMVATARQCGISSFNFALSFILAVVVMYDAMGVRRAAGEQAKVINLIVNNLVDKTADEEEPMNLPEKKLKEYLGHTPTQVLAGAILGGIIAFVM